MAAHARVTVIRIYLECHSGRAMCGFQPRLSIVGLASQRVVFLLAASYQTSETCDQVRLISVDATGPGYCVSRQSVPLLDPDIGGEEFPTFDRMPRVLLSQSGRCPGSLWARSLIL